MKREMDLIRLLLLQAECEKEVNLNQYTKEQIEYHKALLVDSGLCRGVVMRDGQGNPTQSHIVSLEWEGHDFLDAAKDNEIWTKVKNKVIQAGGALTFGVILELLKSELKNKFGI